MEIQETLEGAFYASVWLSWIAVIIALVPAWAIAGASRMHRRAYWVACLLGGLAGEFCAVNSLFIGLWFHCRRQNPCNTAQGDLALIFLIPLETCSGSLLASGFTWLTLRITERSPSNRIFRGAAWTLSILFQVAFCLSATWCMAHLMA